MKFFDDIKKNIAERIVNSARSYPEGDRSSEGINQENVRNVYSMYTNEFANLNSTQLKFYLDAARRGLYFFKALIFEEMRKKDLHIGGVCQTRKLGIVGKHDLHNIEKYIECEDETMKQFVVDALGKINISALVTEITDSGITGISDFEINYIAEGGKALIGSVNKIGNDRIVYDDRDNSYKYLGDESLDVFKLRNAAAVIGVEDRIDYKYLNLVGLPEVKSLRVLGLDGNSRSGLMNGCIDSLIWSYLFKSYGIKDLHVFIELFAIPAIIGKYDPLMNKEDKNKLRDAIKNFGNHFRMVVSKDADIDFMTDANKGTTANIFLDTIGYWDSKISIRVLGQTLTTEVKGGSYAAAQTHDSVREDILRADMVVVTMALNTLIKKMIDINFASVKKYPVFKFPESISLSDKKSLSEIYEAVKRLGYKVGKEQIMTELEVNELEEYESSNEGQEVEIEKKEEQKKVVEKFIGVLNKFADNPKKISDNEIEEFINQIYKEAV